MFPISQLKLAGLSSNLAHQNHRIVIEQRYLVRRLVHRYAYFNVYEGIDLKVSKFVMIYIKPSTTDFNFSKKIKEDLRNKVSPPIIWSGNHKIQKNTYNVEVHQKFGPSLKSMFDYIKDPITQQDFLLLMYQFIRLIQKYASVGYVYRELDMSHIIFDGKPEKNELYLLNVFSLKKKGEETQMLNSRFCSRGAHLGLKSSSKDDLESICYILINIHTQGAFLRNTPCEEYAQAKANLNLHSFKRPLPSLFYDFYSYVINLNFNDEVNYFKWRNLIYRSIGKDAVTHPYEWMMAKQNASDTESDVDDETLGQEMKKVDMKELEDQIRPEDKVFMQKLKKSELLRNARR